jgi:hypothetical protein
MSENKLLPLSYSLQNIYFVIVKAEREVIFKQYNTVYAL